MSAYEIPYVPSAPDRVKTMLELAGIRPGEKMLDLGAGEGNLVLAFAQKGVKATGVEIDRRRAETAKKNVEKADLDSLAEIYHRNFWYEDVSFYDIITIYGISMIMYRLSRKLKKEAKSGCRIISNTFLLPDWDISGMDNNIYLYIR
ncbi:MAG: hypothetical protein UV73_C0008G0064 [Candidatus Gottesmanbacteria bacterium GW2011_GWA2_43_14]|uniref:Methyltransferase domain-containing protein n=1 Tax=Candidatus Gottesmanbacteria bacterium GW2011_GWA2_43_14 TaxID=1618443 RepID=A0A0G1DIM1_9BACT|nr:MAG: hypothetical protein UV73_C0008G0064 [Candidatus Gottesmanbacteria bacterium GW2011_GWA2_43_14]